MSPVTAALPRAELDGLLTRVTERHTLLLNIRSLQTRRLAVQDEIRSLWAELSQLDRMIEAATPAVRAVMQEIAGAP